MKFLAICLCEKRIYKLIVIAINYKCLSDNRFKKASRFQIENRRECFSTMPDSQNQKRLLMKWTVKFFIEGIMKRALIVGGDHVDGIRHTLQNAGVESVAHWSGRKAGDAKQVIPQDTQMVVILTDWINHALTGKVKRRAQKLGLRILYARGNGGNLQGPLTMMTSA